MSSIGGAIGQGVMDIGTSMIKGDMEANRAESMANRNYDRQGKYAQLMYDLEMRKWRNTGYVGQVNEMRKAGLNPALMYGMGGGASGQSQTAGGAGAAQESNQNFYDAGIQVGNLAVTQAQADLMKAQAENLNADTENKRGLDREVGTATIDKLISETQNNQAKTILTNTQNRLTEIEEKYQDKTLENRIAMVSVELNKLHSESSIMANQKGISDGTWEQAIKLFKLEVIKAELDNALLDANIDLTEAQIDKIATEISIGNREQARKEIETAVGIGRPNVMQWAGEGLNRFVNAVNELTGQKTEAKEGQEKLKETGGSYNKHEERRKRRNR